MNTKQKYHLGKQLSAIHLDKIYVGMKVSKLIGSYQMPLQEVIIVQSRPEYYDQIVLKNLENGHIEVIAYRSQGEDYYFVEV